MVSCRFGSGNKGKPSRFSRTKFLSYYTKKSYRKSGNFHCTNIFIVDGSYENSYINAYALLMIKWYRVVPTKIFI